MNDSSKVLLTFVGGAVVGAALGILFAPDKGSNTRKKIISQAKDLSDDITDTASEKYKEFTDWKNKMMEKGENLEDSFREDLEKSFHNGASKTDHVAQKAESKLKNA